MSFLTARSNALIGAFLIVTAITLVADVVIPVWQIVAFWILFAVGASFMTLATVQAYEQWINDEDWDEWFEEID